MPANQVKHANNNSEGTAPTPAHTPAQAAAKHAASGGAPSPTAPKSAAAPARTPRTPRTPRVILGGIALGCAAFACAFCALQFALPTQSTVDNSLNYGYVYSGAKSASVDFVAKNQTSASVLLFGSSELSTPAATVAQVPAVVFGTNNYGIDLTLIGEAYDQSLWQTIAAGAYAGTTETNKVAIIVSPTWFEDAGLDSDTFNMRFSYSLYQAFCENENISNSTKQYVAARLLEQGVDSSKVNAGLSAAGLAVSEGSSSDSSTTATTAASALIAAPSAINNAIYSTIDDLQIRQSLLSVRSRGMAWATTSGSAQTPDFAALYESAIADAAQSCTNNSWGMDDAFYSSSIAPNYERLANSQSDETFSNQQEFQDFSMFLTVCEEVGLEPLVIISPVHGQFYDYVGTISENRQACYNQILQIANNHSATVADFSDAEYSNYFLHDIVHFGWTGWVAVEEAIYNYVKD